MRCIHNFHRNRICYVHGHSMSITFQILLQPNVMKILDCVLSNMRVQYYTLCTSIFVHHRYLCFVHNTLALKHSCTRREGKEKKHRVTNDVGCVRTCAIWTYKPKNGITASTKCALCTKHRLHTQPDTTFVHRKTVCCAYVCEIVTMATNIRRETTAPARRRQRLHTSFILSSDSKQNFAAANQSKINQTKPFLC